MNDLAKNSLSDAIHSRLTEMGADPIEGDSGPVITDEPEEDIAERDEGQALETGDEADDELESEQDEEGEGDGEEEGLVAEKYKVTELADAIGWNAKDLYESLVVPFGDGTSKTLGELKNERDTIIEQQQALEQQRAEIAQQHQALQQAQQQLYQGQQSMSAEEEQARGERLAIEAQYSNVDWDKLDNDDPGRAANLRQRFATAYSAAQRREQQAKQQREQQGQQYMQQMLQQHHQKVVELVPEWKDPNVLQEESQKIGEHLLTFGFTPQEINSIYHAGARALARDAWLWHQHKQQVGEATTKVRKAPKKVLRTGRRVTGNQIRNDRVAALEKKAMSSQNQGDKLQAARAILESSLSSRKR